ncbi:MAG TPA: glycosyltransferase [Desulfonatronum sp.]|nr:glycosyltransferase [Desulfonatronum sp.]
MTPVPASTRPDVLFLAPHPFYQERGTPMAVDLLLGVLARRGLRTIVVTFAEGQDKVYPRTTVHRIPALPWAGKGVPPGFSLKKLVCDVFLFCKALGIVVRRRPRLVHAVEESVFMALFFRILFNIPYVYDMDSSMSVQILHKLPVLKPLGPFFRWCEGVALRRALVVIPVCAALADIARLAGARQIHVLTDVSMAEAGAAGESAPDLRAKYGIQGVCCMYIGNLEPYQGIDLLLAAAALALKTVPELRLVIVGGTTESIAAYQSRARNLGIAEQTHFTGPLPVSMMHALFSQADVLVSPRIKGENTPMKIYSYLDSGRPILATDLPTHTQVLTSEIAQLVRPEARSMAEGMVRLAASPELREQLALAARELARSEYTPEVFERRVNVIYDHLLTQVEQQAGRKRA